MTLQQYQCPCGETYDKDHSLDLTSQRRDQDWSLDYGRCYFCYLRFLVEIYGGMMEPVFKVGTVLITADGPLTSEDDEPVAF